MAITKYTDVDGYGIPYNKDGNWGGGGSGGGTTYTLTEGSVGTDPAVKLNGNDGTISIAKFDGNDFKFDLGMIKAKGYSMRVTDSTSSTNGMFELLKDGNPIASWGYNGSDFNVETDATGYTTISAVGGTSSARHLAVSTDPDGWNLYLSDDMGMQIGSCIKFPASMFTFNESMPDYFDVALKVMLSVDSSTATTDGRIALTDGNNNVLNNSEIYVDHNSMSIGIDGGKVVLKSKGGTTGGKVDKWEITDSTPTSSASVALKDIDGTTVGNPLGFKLGDFTLTGGELKNEMGQVHNIKGTASSSTQDGRVDLTDKSGYSVGKSVVFDKDTLKTELSGNNIIVSAVGGGTGSDKIYGHVLGTNAYGSPVLQNYQLDPDYTNAVHLNGPNCRDIAFVSGFAQDGNGIRNTGCTSVVPDAYNSNILFRFGDADRTEKKLIFNNKHFQLRNTATNEWTLDASGTKLYQVNLNMSGTSDLDMTHRMYGHVTMYVPKNLSNLYVTEKYLMDNDLKIACSGMISTMSAPSTFDYIPAYVYCTSTDNLMLKAYKISDMSSADFALDNRLITHSIFQIVGES